MQLYGIVGTSELYAVAAGLEHTLPAGAVAVAFPRPTPSALLQQDGTWLMVPTPPKAEPLDLNSITYSQADALVKATSVEELQASILGILGL